MKFTMRTAPFQFRNAILHMIGQMQDMQQTVTTSDIAIFCGVSKPTAQKYLRDLWRTGSLNITIREWHKNAKVFEWKLTERSFENYKMHAYIGGYKRMLEMKFRLSF